MNKLNFAVLLIAVVLFIDFRGFHCIAAVASERRTLEGSIVAKLNIVPVECSKYGEDNCTCELNPPVKAAILNIEKILRSKVESLQNTVEEIANLLKKQNQGKNKDQHNTSSPGKDCADLYKKGNKKSGVYLIDPDGKGSFKVFCDMTTSGGGWTVFQRRLDGSVDFYRGWQDYKQGFGNIDGEYWLGLDKIHRLTNASQNKLRIDMEDTSGNWKYAEYDLFAVTGEEQKYELSLGKYSGTAGDSFTHHKGMAFSTKDSDNDATDRHCAATYKGAWWYAGCHYSNLNGLYHYGPHESLADGVIWYHWKGYKYSLKTTSMKIRPREF